nr:reverse transcriptase domain-containing protein [Tanacetum cinerariifolium]
MPRECLAIIESKSKVRYSRNKPVVAKVSMDTSTSGISPDVAELKDMVKALLIDKKSQNQAPTTVKVVEESCVTCGGAYSYRNCPATNVNVYRNNIQEFISQAFAVNYNQGNTSYHPPMMSNQIRPPAYQAPSYQAPAPQTQSVSKEDFSAYVKANDAVMRNMQTHGQNIQNQLTNLTNLLTKFMNSNSASTSSSDTSPSKTIANTRSDLKAITTRSGVSYDGPQILPSPSFLPKVVENKPEATKDTVTPPNNEGTEDIQPSIVPTESLILNSKPVNSPIIEPVSSPIFQDMSFEIRFTNALILIPKFSLTLKALIGNKEKLSEMARTPLNEHCSVVLLKKLLEILGDPGKFLIPCDFPRMDECLALADLSASINLMPLFVWKILSLPEFTLTCMTHELADRSISRPIGVAKDVYVKVGKFYFLADFVIVDFDADPRVSLTLGRYFLKIGRALIDVFKGKLTLRAGKEAITFNLDQTLRYSANYNDNSINQIDVIEMACEEYSQEVLGFFDVIASGNPTPYYDLIVSTTSPTLTPFGNSDFFLEEVDAFLALEDDPTSPNVDQTYVDSEGDILLLEAFLNDDPLLPPPNQGNYLPKVHKELKICEAKSDKSSIDEPSEEKTALITVLKSHKRAIAWKLFDIKGIDPEFCTHKILMEEDFKPAVQHQRRVNPKIHDVIKQEVLKLLDAGLIYSISNSLWVNLVHCIPKKGGFTDVENEDNELILTRLVTGWHVCIDYHKLNEVTRKDYFPLPFMDQMLERLAGNRYYCFLNGFSSYFQIPIDPKDPKTTTFTCPYGTFAYRCIPFGLCNAPSRFQRCMMAIFHAMIKKTMEVFMDDFLVFGNSFQSCGIVLDHKISKQGIKVDKAKVDVITKLPHPTTVKDIQIFIGHAGFYQRFIKDFSKIARPMTRLLKKDTPFIFSKKCVEAFEKLKRKLTEAPMLIAPDWDMPFERMCDASDFAIGAVLEQLQDKHFRPIHYASKTMTVAKSHYTTTEKEMLAVVYAFEKFQSYLIMNKSIVYTDHSALKYLFAKKDSMARLLRWVLLLQEFTFKVIDTKGAENLAADHLS